MLAAAIINNNISSIIKIIIICLLFSYVGHVLCFWILDIKNKFYAPKSSFNKLLPNALGSCWLLFYHDYLTPSSKHKEYIKCLDDMMLTILVPV